MQHTYKYTGQPLTTKMVQELIMEYFVGQTIKTKDLKKQVDELHRNRGGRKFTNKHNHPVTYALWNLKKDEVANNPKHGSWQIGPQPIGPSPSSLETESDENDSAAPRTIGSGNGYVYLYYYPAYKLLTGFQGESSWPCKIGMTEDDPNPRTFAQAGTGMPEEPEIGLIIKTDTPSDIERRIHDILRIFDRHIEDAPGTEWFLTNPDQVEEIFNSL